MSATTRKAVRAVLRARRARFARTLATLRGDSPQPLPAARPRAREAPPAEEEQDRWTEPDPLAWVTDVHEALDDIQREIAYLRRMFAISVNDAPLVCEAWDVLRHLDNAYDEIVRERAEFLRKH